MNNNVSNIKTMTMKCKEVKKLLPEFVEGNIQEQKMKDIDFHLNNCPDCMFLFEKLKSTMSMLKPKSEISEQAFYYTRLKQKMENRYDNARNYGLGWLKRSLQPVAYVVSLVLAVYIGILIGSGSTNKSQLSDMSTSDKDYIQTFAESQYINDYQLEKIENIFTTDYKSNE